MATPYKINIPLYEGPLDLLLDLIKKQEMNIHDIPIAKITSQYLDYLHKLEELNVDVSADFIYMAATLIYIKSKMLLPPDPLASAELQAVAMIQEKQFGEILLRKAKMFDIVFDENGALRQISEEYR